MLAYVFWHRPEHEVAPAHYERALTAFHRSLASRPPVGFRGSAALRASRLPWLAAPDGSVAGGYEDWYLLDSWSAVGVLQAAAISSGHLTAHERVAQRSGPAAGAIYRLLEGELRPGDARHAVWVTRGETAGDPRIADLLEDGMMASESSLWRRCLVLGPAPELCLLSSGAPPGPETGTAPQRLSPGWSAGAAARASLFDH